MRLEQEGAPRIPLFQPPSRRVPDSVIVLCPLVQDHLLDAFSSEYTKYVIVDVKERGGWQILAAHVNTCYSSETLWFDEHRVDEERMIGGWCDCSIGANRLREVGFRAAALWCVLLEAIGRVGSEL